VWLMRKSQEKDLEAEYSKDIYLYENRWQRPEYVATIHATQKQEREYYGHEKTFCECPEHVEEREEAARKIERELEREADRKRAEERRKREREEEAIRRQRLHREAEQRRRDEQARLKKLVQNSGRWPQEVPDYAKVDTLAKHGDEYYYFWWEDNGYWGYYLPVRDFYCVKCDKPFGYSGSRPYCLSCLKRWDAAYIRPTPERTVLEHIPPKAPEVERSTLTDKEYKDFRQYLTDAMIEANKIQSVIDPAHLRKMWRV